MATTEKQIKVEGIINSLINCLKDFNFEFIQTIDST